MAVMRYLTVIFTFVVSTQGQHFRQNEPSLPPHAPSRFNFFDIELLKSVIANEGAHNFVISPASAKAVLGMLLEGARGESAEQIEKVLRLKDNRVSHQMIFKSFLQTLKVRYPGTLVEIANQIFLNTGLKVSNTYKQALEEIYYSGVHNVDFSESRLAAGAINSWVGKNTHGLIRTLVTPDGIDRNTKAVVANALYFKGRWAIPFNPKGITVRCFHTTANTCRNAYFMEAVGQYGYADLKDLNARSLELHYQGSRFSMLFILPNNGVDELLRDLSYQPLNSIIPKLETMTVVVSIPRFSIEFNTDLIRPLMQLGINDIFTPAANFSGMLEKGGNIAIGQFLQKAVIEVNEEGTVGAAASGAVAVPLHGSIIPKFQLSKPFLFFVRDVETGHYLFEGLVDQPELAIEGNNQPTASRVGPPPHSTLLFQTNPSNQNAQNNPGNVGSISPGNPQIQTSNNPNTPTNGSPGSSHGNNNEELAASASSYQPITKEPSDSLNYPPV